MGVPINLPDDLAAEIDEVSGDRTAFVAEAVRRLLRESNQKSDSDETARINDLAEELNREAADVLEYQIIP
jgi:metal-responsive CopG/Arc/MetJ family transcriptional regulator